MRMCDAHRRLLALNELARWIEEGRPSPDTTAKMIRYLAASRVMTGSPVDLFRSMSDQEAWQ